IEGLPELLELLRADDGRRALLLCGEDLLRRPQRRSVLRRVLRDGARVDPDGRVGGVPLRRLRREDDVDRLRAGAVRQPAGGPGATRAGPFWTGCTHAGRVRAFAGAAKEGRIRLAPIRISSVRSAGIDEMLGIFPTGRSALRERLALGPSKIPSPSTGTDFER